MPLSQTQQDILSLLRKASHVLILPSSPLDGDSIGSSLSLYLALKKMGKKATVVAEESIPSLLGFLPETAAVSKDLHFMRDFIVTIDCREAPPENVRHEIQGNKVNIIVTPTKGGITKEHVSFSEGPLPYDCIVTVDAAEPAQFGKIYDNFPEIFHLAPVINIDHHASNTGFGKINLVDVMAPSTTTMVLPLIQELGSQLIDADIATLILAGLITDTGSFQNSNTTPDAFAIAAKLIGMGARQQEIIRNVYKTKKLSQLRLWGRTLTKLQYDEKNKLVWSVLSARDFGEIGSSPDETDGVIDELMSNAPGAEVILLLKEKEPTEVSGSLRTLSSAIDASKLAVLFGGGGHVQAAGFKISGKSIADVETTVVAALKEAQQKRLGVAGAAAPLPSLTISNNIQQASGAPAPIPLSPIANPMKPVAALPIVPELPPSSPPAASILSTPTMPAPIQAAPLPPPPASTPFTAPAPAPQPQPPLPTAPSFTSPAPEPPRPIPPTPSPFSPAAPAPPFNPQAARPFPPPPDVI